MKSSEQEENGVSPYSKFQTVSGTTLSILIWLIIYIIGYAIFAFFSIVQETNSWLEALFREILFSGIGGYYAFFVTRKWMPRANFNFVFWGFCSLIFIFMIGTQITGIIYCPLSHECTFIWSEKITTCLSGVAALLGARIARIS